jgi:hypothetical protein
MVELIEYALVMMASMLFVAGSVLTYDGFTTFESGLSLHASFDGVSGLVSEAIANGSATATMAIPSSAITCQGGKLSMKIGGSSLNESIPLGCAFEVSVPGGVRTLEFRDNSSQLEISVS